MPYYSWKTLFNIKFFSENKQVTLKNKQLLLFIEIPLHFMLKETFSFFEKFYSISL